MSTQIAISIDTDRKQNLSRVLKSNGITAKWFLISCIDAFLNGELKLGIKTSYNSDMYLTKEERENYQEALEEIRNWDYSDYDDLEDVMNMLWYTKSK